MGFLVFVTVLWAFSFSLIGEFLAGRVDSYFAVLTRVLLAALVFLPLTRWRGVPAGLKKGILVTACCSLALPTCACTKLLVICRCQRCCCLPSSPLCM